MDNVNPNSPVVVYANNSALGPIAAAFLPQPQGGYVVDPNPQTAPIYQYNSSGQLVQVANPNNFLVVPADFSVASALNFASQIRALLGSPNPETAYLAMTLAFKTGGSQDLQRNYDGQTWNFNSGSGRFVPAFTSAASWYLGFVAQQSGIPVAAAINGGDLWNQWQNGQWIPQNARRECRSRVSPRSIRVMVGLTAAARASHGPQVTGLCRERDR
jgi:hypothetical protein